LARLRGANRPAVRLHPNAAAFYAAKVAYLNAALDQPDIRLEAMEVLRSLIERMVLTPNEATPNGSAIELFGDLATILNLASSTGPALAQSAGGRTSKNPQAAGVFGSTFSVVAGARFELTTFRL